MEGTRGYREEEDFYRLLGCDESSTPEQISTEFKIMAREYHPDKVTDPDAIEASEKRFVLLKRARDVLLDRETRQQYDQWRQGFKNWISFHDWQKMQGRVHTSIHWGGGAHRVASLEQHRGGEEENDGDDRGEGGEGARAMGTELSAGLQQFRRGGGGGGGGASKFRNYQL